MVVYLFLFKGVLLFCAVLIMGGVASIMGAATVNQTWLLSGVLAVVYAVCIFWALSNYAKSKMIKLQAKLNRECRVEGFARQMEKMLPVPGRSNNNYVLISAANGWLLKGNAEKAEALLAQVRLDAESEKSGELQMAVNYHYNKVYAALLAKDAPRAAKELEALQAACRHPQLKALWDGYNIILKQAESWLRMVKGDYHAAAKVFEEMYEVNDGTLNKSAAKYALGCIYARTGKAEKAAEALQWAAENGGDSWYAAHAAKKLAELE